MFADFFEVRKSMGRDLRNDVSGGRSRGIFAGFDHRNAAHLLFF